MNNKNRNDATTRRYRQVARRPSHAKTLEEPGVREDEVARKTVDAALSVHRALGPGLLESVYEFCLRRELIARGIAVKRQVQLPIHYRGVTLVNALRLDLVVDGLVVVELKAVEKLLPIHAAQVLTYLKLSGIRVGLLMNFNTLLLKDGLKRLVHTHSSLK